MRRWTGENTQSPLGPIPESCMPSCVLCRIRTELYLEEQEELERQKERVSESEREPERISGHLLD